MTSSKRGGFTWKSQDDVSAGHPDLGFARLRASLLIPTYNKCAFLAQTLEKPPFPNRSVPIGSR